MVILEDLPVKKRMEYLQKLAEALRIRGTDKSLTYEIKQSSKTTVNGQELLNAASEQEWIIKNVVCSNDAIIYDITFVKNEITKHSSIYNDIMEFSRRLHFIYDHLLLSTDRDGYLNKVINQKEIAAKWEHLKTYELAEYFSDTKIEEVKSALDKEIKNPLPGLKSDWLYILFFIPFPSDLRKKEYTGKTYKQDNIKTKSIFLHGINVELENRETLKDITDDSIILKQSSELVNDFRFFGETEAQKSYKKQYEDLFGKKFLHKFHHSADYVLDRQTGLIRTCKAIISERLNEQIYAEIIYDIKQKITEI